MNRKARTRNAVMQFENRVQFPGQRATAPRLGSGFGCKVAVLGGTLNGATTEGTPTNVSGGTMMNWNHSTHVFDSGESIVVYNLTDKTVAPGSWIMVVNIDGLWFFDNVFSCSELS